MSPSEMIAALASNPGARGRVFVVNLLDSITLQLIDGPAVKAGLEDFLNEESTRSKAGAPPGSVSSRVDRLGRFLVKRGLWRSGQVPDLNRHQGRSANPVLSRVVTWTDFHRWVIGQHPDAPEPIAHERYGREVSVADEPRAREALDSGRWRDWVPPTHAGRLIEFRMEVLWMAPASPLVVRAKADPARRHRDLIGLNHLAGGRNLVRLDFDVSRIDQLQTAQRRRPHGAGNGGQRFRAAYEGRQFRCGWGRTVDLGKVGRTKLGPWNGVPELLTSGFAADPDAIQANYLGLVSRNPETLDNAFVERLLGTRSMVAVCSNLDSLLE